MAMQTQTGKGTILGLGTALFLGTAFLAGAAEAEGQTYVPGQMVYATPSGATNGWYSGCIVQAGRSNSSYRVACAGTTSWVSSEHIRTSPPRTTPDPMRPGEMLVPVVTPSAGTRPASPSPARPAPTTQPSQTSSSGTDTATGTAKKIAQDQAGSAPGALAAGTYTCYSMGQYTFTDLNIRDAHTYSVNPGGSGSYRYSKGALTFLSGPYAGAYSRMVDSHTIGVSAKGSTNLGTQCGLEK